MNFYVVGMSAEDVKAFFAALPEDKRPKVVDDKSYPAVWDHPSDDPVVIVTDEPRTDTDATQLQLEGAQLDEVQQQLHPNEEPVTSDDITVEVPEPAPQEEPVRGPMTFRDRGFKVGRLV